MIFYVNTRAQVNSPHDLGQAGCHGGVLQCYQRNKRAVPTRAALRKQFPPESSFASFASSFLLFPFRRGKHGHCETVAPVLRY